MDYDNFAVWVVQTFTVVHSCTQYTCVFVTHSCDFMHTFVLLNMQFVIYIRPGLLSRTSQVTLDIL